MVERAMYMFIQEKKLNLHLKPFILLSCMLSYSFTVYAQNYSYRDAEQQVLTHSYSTQAQNALEQAAQLEADANRGLGLPRVNLNARAYKFHAETDVPLGQFKQNLEDQLTQRTSDGIDQIGGKIGIPSNVIDQINTNVAGSIQESVNKFPDYAALTLDDEVFRSSISVTMPIYTGGLIQSAKNISAITAHRSRISSTQQQDVQRFELIQAYFNVQLQKQLLKSSQDSLNAMQLHVDHAFKLERQGFISRGQRMQFEVARNNVMRLQQNAASHLATSEFQLKNILNTDTLAQLTTPLFVNNSYQPDVENLLEHFAESSPTLQKLTLDRELASEKVSAQSAAKKPKIFAFGEYALNQQNNWIVGVAASYNLFSGVDHHKQIQAAELQRHAVDLMTSKAKQDISSVLYTAYHELKSAQQSHQLLKQNMLAAQENLRIESLSFREGMGTAAQVIDAESAISNLKSETALNAFKYVMSLATLLQNYGATEQFKVYAQQSNNDTIGD